MWEWWGVHKVSQGNEKGQKASKRAGQCYWLGHGVSAKGHLSEFCFYTSRETDRGSILPGDYISKKWHSGPWERYLCDADAGDTYTFFYFFFFLFATKCSMWDLSFPTRHQTAPTAMEGQSQPWTAREVLTSFLLNNDFRKGGQEPIFRVSAGTKNEFF